MYNLDPWGEQRADMRSAKEVWATLQVASRTPIDPNDHMLFPDVAHGLDEDATEQERQWMLKLIREAD